MDNVIHFEIPYDNKERAEKFYSQIFGWALNPYPEMNYTVVHTCEIDKANFNMPKKVGMINGGMFKRSEDVKTVSITINVRNIDETLEKIKKHGGKVLREKTSVGDMGFIAYFKDSEGNLVGLWETVPMKS